MLNPSPVLADSLAAAARAVGSVLSGASLTTVLEAVQPRTLRAAAQDLAFNALHAGIIDKMIVYVAPKILGGREVPVIAGQGMERLSEAIPLQEWSVETCGPDLVITTYVHRNY